MRSETEVSDVWMQANRTRFAAQKIGNFLVLRNAAPFRAWFEPHS